MNEIKKENPRTITKHQWCVINQMLLDDVRWGYTVSYQGIKRYTFWLERGHLSPELIHLRMKSDGVEETSFKTFKLGDELSSIAKQMLAIGWQLWMDEKNR